MDFRVRILAPGATETWNTLLLESSYKHKSTSVSLEPDTHACMCSHTHTRTHMCTHTCKSHCTPNMKRLYFHRIYVFVIDL